MTKEEILQFNREHKIDSYPGNMKKVRTVFDGLPIEKAIEYRDFWKAYFAERYGKGYNPSSRFMSRSLSLMDKYIQERTTAEDATYDALIDRLCILLADYLEMYMDRISQFATRQYQWATSCLHWNPIDWLGTGFTSKGIRVCYFQSCVVPYRAANGLTVWLSFTDKNGKRVDKVEDIISSETYTYSYGSMARSRSNIAVSPADLAHARMCDSAYFEIPAAPAISKQQVLFNTIKAKAGFGADGEEKWVAEALNEADAKFMADIKVMADKIREKSIREDNHSLVYAGDDPKHIEIEITDGQATLYARSIFAAENSVLVSPHFRFIVTETAKK